MLRMLLEHSKDLPLSILKLKGLISSFIRDIYSNTADEITGRLIHASRRLFLEKEDISLRLDIFSTQICMS